MPNNRSKTLTPAATRYTCAEYREEMVLLGLKQKLHDPALTESEKTKLEKEIADLEKKIGF